MTYFGCLKLIFFISSLYFVYYYVVTFRLHRTVNTLDGCRLYLPLMLHDIHQIEHVHHKAHHHESEHDSQKCHLMFLTDLLQPFSSPADAALVGKPLPASTSRS